MRSCAILYVVASQLVYVVASWSVDYWNSVSVCGFCPDIFDGVGSRPIYKRLCLKHSPNEAAFAAGRWDVMFLKRPFRKWQAQQCAVELACFCAKMCLCVKMLPQRKVL